MEVHVDVTNKVLSAAVDPLAKNLLQHEIKNEFSLSDSHSPDMNIKSETLDSNLNTMDSNDDIDIKFKALVKEEIDIKDEIDEFTTNQSLNNSIVKKTFICAECGYRAGKKYHLERHVRIHTGEKPFECKVCKYRCGSRGDLNKHVKIHFGIKLFKCEVCEYRCVQKGSLKQHMIKHTGEKPFECELCKYRFGSKQSLNHHIRLHSTDQVFMCEICEYRCVKECYLKEHMRIHIGRRPFINGTYHYRCDMCDHKSTNKQSLLQHMKIHNGEKPFKCLICGFQFIWKRSLELHIKVLHTESKA